MHQSSDRVIRVGDVDAPPGQIQFGGIICAYLPDATPIKIPLIVVNGAREGPVLLVTAALHGIEIGGIEVIRQLTREVVNPQQLRGAIVAAPILNPFAYHAARMNTPQDEYNLNRVFPGGPDQLLSHRLADLIVSQIVVEADYLIDFHSNVTPAIPFVIVRRTDPPMFEKCCKMADAFGVTTVEMSQQLEQHRTGSMSDWALAHNIPSIAVELIDTRRLNPAAIKMGVRGVLNVMKALDMLDGKLEEQVELPVRKGHLTRMEITANKGGLVHPAKNAGDSVAKGEVLATLFDPYGDMVDEIKSPVNGFVLAYPLRESQAVATGNMIVFLAFDPGQRS
ncbi:MAG: succinylglutamate desuccinylase/aspartoacylase family protein [Chloroflexi bacterium]|nr:succinylglutamate desuccinylase/aspartoacylase family protein [Chloroflexota bacterium]